MKTSNSMQQIAQEETVQQCLCEECRTACESKQDFNQWQENELCRGCNDLGFEEYRQEVVSEPFR